MGNLCRNPSTWEDGRATAYQVGVNRNFFLHNDSPEVHSDYPYVRSYGRQADADIVKLHKGDVVFVDGFLRNRTFDRVSVCPECDTEILWKDKALEIVPYTVQYL